MNEGFILLHRKMLENAIFYKADYYQIWCYILLKVNHKDNEFIWNNEKRLVKKGTGIFSQKKISQELRIPIGTVHNALKYLKSENQIEIKSTTKFTEIQVVKWEQYQDFESIIENRMKTNRKQNETNKHDKHDKQLLDQCQEFVKTYGQDMINDFLRYWQEKNNKGVEKWKLQKTWETKLRLATWKRNDFGNKKPVQKINGANGVIL
jgi:hypothetical protein